MTFDVNKLGSLEGKQVIVTGANSGIGFEATKILARKGASVVLACRNVKKGTDAVNAVLKENPTAKVEFMQIDLSSLANVRAFASNFIQKYDKLNILINNAGVMALPNRTETSEGLEMQIGVNHFGHFALTGLLLPVLIKSRPARIVNISSGAHRIEKRIKEEDYTAKKYSKWRSYCVSKLSNLFFTKALDARLKKAGYNDLICVCCHPGYSNTDLQQHSSIFMMMNKVLAQSSYMGSLPTVMAATAEDLKGGEFIGPRWFGYVGAPVLETPASHVQNVKQQEKLWHDSERITKVQFDFLVPGSRIISSL